LICGVIGVRVKPGCLSCSDSVGAEEYQGILQHSQRITDLDARHGRHFMQDGRFLGDCGLIFPAWPIKSRD
jgi:hypothetical protein